MPWLVCLVVVTCMPWWFVPWSLCLGWYWLEVVTCMPWWFVLVGSGYLHALVVGVSLCALVVCPWLVVGGYLHALVVRALVVCPWLVVGGYLHALVVRALVVGRLVVWRLLVYLGACVLVTFSGPAKFVPWCVVTCIPWSLCLAGCCWLVVSCMPWSLCLGGW